MVDILVDNDNFTLNRDISGPALAVAVAIEFILSLASNLFILLFTLCHPKTLKHPSIIFLTNFIFANLLVTVFVMPFTIVAASAGEWIFGETLQEKDRTCQFAGFAFAHGTQLTNLTLTVISIDRFLFIVKPFVHKRFMKTWVAVLIVVCMWLLACVINLPPYFGLGQYAFGQFTATCLQVWVGHGDFLAYYCLIILMAVATITVTTVWTFCFTRRFIKRTYYPSSNKTGNDDFQKHVYTRRMRKLTGIFGALLIVTLLTYVPAVVGGVVGIAIGIDNLPAPVFAVIVIFFYINSIANPMIQSYFRKDVNEFIVRNCQRVLKCVARKPETPLPSTSGQLSTQLSNLNVA